MTGVDDLDPYDELQDALRLTTLARLRVVKIVCPHYRELLDVLRVNGRLIVVRGSIEIVLKPQTWTPQMIKLLEPHGLNPSNFSLHPGPVLAARFGHHKQYGFLRPTDPPDEPDSNASIEAPAPRCCHPRIKIIDMRWLNEVLAEYDGEFKGQRVKVFAFG